MDHKLRMSNRLYGYQALRTGLICKQGKYKSITVDKPFV